MIGHYPAGQVLSGYIRHDHHDIPAGVSRLCVELQKAGFIPIHREADNYGFGRFSKTDERGRHFVRVEGGVSLSSGRKFYDLWVASDSPVADEVRSVLQNHREFRLYGRVL